mgnify:CR=1 FL=1
MTAGHPTRRHLLASAGALALAAALPAGAFAQELGVQQYQWDIPRSHLLGLEAGPFQITTANNRVALNVVGSTQTKSMVFSLPVGQHTASSLAAIAHTAGIVSGERFFDAISIEFDQHLIRALGLKSGIDAGGTETGVVLLGDFDR